MDIIVYNACIYIHETIKPKTQAKDRTKRKKQHLRHLEEPKYPAFNKSWNFHHWPMMRPFMGLEYLPML